VAAIAAALAGRPGALAVVGAADPPPRRAAVALVLRVPLGAAGRSCCS
jgi:hypothetical protein